MTIAAGSGGEWGGPAAVRPVTTAKCGSPPKGEPHSVHQVSSEPRGAVDGAWWVLMVLSIQPT
ncbi:hypothetical protein GCM10010433_69990 [Streptomyces pulveraceus]